MPRWASLEPLRERWFLAVLGLGVVLRALAMLGYRPALWFPDSYTYVVTAMRPRPDLVRPAGYSMFLRLFEPLHSFALVTGVQHLLGILTGVMVYLTARRLRAPAWAATLACVPVLLDAYQVELEHLLVSDTLFTALVVAAVCLAVRESGDRRGRMVRAGVIGLLVAAATLTRTVGLPLVVLLGAWLLYRERGRVAVAAVT
ncbi:glycosyltransferase family 39 protein, partial [Streptosporangium algeriense]